MVSGIRELSSLAGCANAVLRPAEEHCDLGHVEWPRAVLEHLWNKTAVHGRGRLVSRAVRSRVHRLKERHWFGTVGEKWRPLVTRSVRLAKAKVAGSNPVFRSI